MNTPIRSIGLMALLVVAACSTGTRAPLVVSDLEITAAMPGMAMQAGYLELSNNTRDTIRISRIESPDFASVELHETTTVDGVARMRSLDTLDVPARGSVRLERGGKHLMLRGAIGQPADVRLEFYAGDDMLLSVEAPVGSP